MNGPVVLTLCALAALLALAGFEAAHSAWDRFEDWAEARWGPKDRVR